VQQRFELGWWNFVFVASRVGRGDRIQEIQDFREWIAVRAGRGLGRVSLIGKRY